MELSAAPEALVTVRAARDKVKGKSEGKGEPPVSNQTQPDSWLREKPNQHAIGVDNVVTGLAIRNALERETRTSAIMMVERVEQFDVFLPVQVCASTLFVGVLSRICNSFLSVHTRL